jgi:hypothetical protein
MATLTTVDGVQITFTPKVISAIADHDANTGFAVTCVHGITEDALQISEPVQEFMKRVRIAKDFAQLTRPNGFPVWINGSAVSSIRSPLYGLLPEQVVELVPLAASPRRVIATSSSRSEKCRW